MESKTTFYVEIDTGDGKGLENRDHILAWWIFYKHDEVQSGCLTVEMVQDWIEQFNQNGTVAIRQILEREYSIRFDSLTGSAYAEEDDEDDDETKSLCCDAPLNAIGEYDSGEIVFECSKCKQRLIQCDECDAMLPLTEAYRSGDEGQYCKPCAKDVAKKNKKKNKRKEPELVDVECPDCGRLINPEPVQTRRGLRYECKRCNELFKYEEL